MNITIVKSVPYNISKFHQRHVLSNYNTIELGLKLANLVKYDNCNDFHKFNVFLTIIQPNSAHYQETSMLIAKKFNKPSALQYAREMFLLSTECKMNMQVTHEHANQTCCIDCRMLERTHLSASEATAFGTNMPARSDSSVQNR